MVFLAVYVDDKLMTSNDENEMIQLKQYLDQQFKIKDLGLLHYFLGIEAIQEAGNIILTQRKFTIDLLKEFNYQDLSPIFNPLTNDVKLDANMGDPFLEPLVYRRLIGKLNNLSNTQPNLAFVVQHLSHFMSSP